MVETKARQRSIVGANDDTYLAAAHVATLIASAPTDWLRNSYDAGLRYL